VEAEDLADEAWIEFRKAGAYKIDDLPILALGFARNMRKEISKQPPKPYTR